MNFRLIKDAAQECGATITERRDSFTSWPKYDMGFHVKFANGYVLSVAHGPGSYSSNQHVIEPYRDATDWEKRHKTKYKPRSKVKSVELAIWGPDKTDGFVVFEDGIACWVKASRLPKIIKALSEEDFGTVCGLANALMEPRLRKEEA